MNPGGDMGRKVKPDQEEWIEVTLVPSGPLTEPAAPADLALLGDGHVVDDALAGRCSGCGEQIAPHPRGEGWVHVGPSDEWHPFAHDPLPALRPDDVEPDWTDVPLWEQTTTCTFGHTGSRVNACERDAMEGSAYCTVHADLN